jgi:hypothetical protein
LRTFTHAILTGLKSAVIDLFFLILICLIGKCSDNIGQDNVGNFCSSLSNCVNRNQPFFWLPEALRLPFMGRDSSTPENLNFILREEQSRKYLRTTKFWAETPKERYSLEEVCVDKI